MATKEEALLMERAASFAPLAEAAGAVLAAVESVILGQHAAVETLLAAYTAGGHALIEGVPGVAKTLLARSLAAALGLDFARVQFTPDLMPADVIGTNVFESRTGEFRLARGPIFTQVFMADEVNRTPPKTQAALLEAMQERQVTIDGVAHLLAPEFFVVATQNPIEFEGTYPLPEAELDRFLVRIEMGIPERAHEIEIFRRAMEGTLAGWGDAESPRLAALEPARAARLRRASRDVFVAGDLLDYVARLAEAVRKSPYVEVGVSPRGCLALLESARGAALVAGRDFATPDDLKRLLLPCWAHRLILTPEAELEGYGVRRLLDEAAAAVEVPR
jgi:MoxR-like ATPase